MLKITIDNSTEFKLVDDWKAVLDKFNISLRNERLHYVIKTIRESLPISEQHNLIFSLCNQRVETEVNYAVTVIAQRMVNELWTNSMPTDINGNILENAITYTINFLKDRKYKWHNEEDGTDSTAKRHGNVAVIARRVFLENPYAERKELIQILIGHGIKKGTAVNYVWKHKKGMHI